MADDFQNTASRSVSAPDIAKPEDPVFAKLFDGLPADSGVFDPSNAYGKLAKDLRTSYAPLTLQIYDKLSQLLVTPDMPAWKDFVDPFYWLAKERGRGESWFDAFRANPGNANKINLIVPLLYDFEVPQTPARKAASAEVNSAVKVYYTEGDTKRSVDALIHAAKTDETYALPLFDLGLLQAAGANWDWSIDLFGKAKARDLTTADRYGQFTDQWIPRLKQYKAMLSSPAGQQTYLYRKDLDAAMVLCQVGQLRSAVALAGDAASFKAFENEPFPYLIAAYAAAKAGQSGEVRHMLQLSFAHCGNRFEEDAVTALFMASNSRG